MKGSSPSTYDDFELLIGVDWADKKHDICEYDACSQQYKFLVIPHTPDAIQAWLLSLQERYLGKRFAIACELTKGPLINALQACEDVVIYPLNPSMVARYRNEARVTQLKAAKPLTRDEAIIKPNALMISLLVPQLQQLLLAIRTLDEEIKELYVQHDDHIIFDSLPGAGPCYAPRLLAAFGEDRARCQSASDIQKYAGIAPVIEAIGQKAWIHWRYHCPKFLRQSLVEWAGQTVRYSYWAKAFYEQQIGKGKSHNVEIRALTFKWIRIVWRCWQDRKAYDESTYLNALRMKGSQLLKYAVDN